MFQQQGLGGNRADTTGSQEFDKGSQEVNDEEKYFPHALNGTTLGVSRKTVLATYLVIRHRQPNQANTWRRISASTALEQVLLNFFLNRTYGFR